MLPVIALIGRPNVGKSTLFNRLTRSRDALVADYPGLTRDRKFGFGKLGPIPYIVIDTGGVAGGEEGIEEAMVEQTIKALQEADAAIIMVDGRSGLTPSDEHVADLARRHAKKTWLAVNKAEGLESTARSPTQNRGRSRGPRIHHGKCRVLRAGSWRSYRRVRRTWRSHQCDDG